jgi:hypothetical protein
LPTTVAKVKLGISLRLDRIGVTELLWNLDEGPMEEQLPRLADLVGAPA